MFPSAYLGFKFYEPSPNYTLIGFGAMGVNALTMNQRSFDRMPPEVQTILMEVGRAYEDQAGGSLNARQESGLKGLEEVGANIKTLPEEARAGWAESLASFSNQQAKDADGRGMPGSEVMKAYLAAVAGRWVRYACRLRHRIRSDRGTHTGCPTPPCCYLTEFLIRPRPTGPA